LFGKYVAQPDDDTCFGGRVCGWLQIHGTHLSDLVTLLTDDAGGSSGQADADLRCFLSEERSPREWTYAQAQSVTIERRLWFGLGAPYDVHGNHIHILSKWKERLEQVPSSLAPAVPRRVHMVKFEHAAMYTRTFLSGRFVLDYYNKSMTHDLRFHPNGCDREFIAHRVGEANAALLWNARPPRLPKEDMMKMTFLCCNVVLQEVHGDIRVLGYTASGRL
jgi:hypothetical protein